MKRAGLVVMVLAAGMLFLTLTGAWAQGAPAFQWERTRELWQMRKQSQLSVSAAVQHMKKFRKPAVAETVAADTISEKNFLITFSGGKAYGLLAKAPRVALYVEVGQIEKMPGPYPWCQADLDAFSDSGRTKDVGVGNVGYTCADDLSGIPGDSIWWTLMLDPTDAEAALGLEEEWYDLYIFLPNMAGSFQATAYSFPGDKVLTSASWRGDSAFAEY